MAKQRFIRQAARTQHVNAKRPVGRSWQLAVQYNCCAGCPLRSDIQRGGNVHRQEQSDAWPSTRVMMVHSQPGAANLLHRTVASMQVRSARPGPREPPQGAQPAAATADARSLYDRTPCSPTKAPPRLNSARPFASRPAGQHDAEHTTGTTGGDGRRGAPAPSSPPVGMPHWRRGSRPCNPAHAGKGARAASQPAPNLTRTPPLKGGGRGGCLPQAQPSCFDLAREAGFASS